MYQLREEAGRYFVTDDGSTKSVAVRFHIVRNSSGSGGASPSLVPTLLSSANAAFAGASLAFVQEGATDFIDDTTRLSIDSAFEADQLRNTKVAPNAINVYLVTTLTLGGVAAGSLSSFSVQEEQGIILAAAALPSGDTSSWQHELGHYFDLFHTWETGFASECPNGSNCATAGDFVCDTPAEPAPPTSGVWFNTTTCAYQPGVTPPQACGSGYTPDGTNFMAFTVASCRTNFTAGQLARARAAYIRYRPELQLPNSATLSSSETHFSNAGHAVAVSKRGAGAASALVGAPGHSSIGTVFVHEKSTLHGAWSSAGALVPSGLGTGDNYGTSVAFDGFTALVGAPGDDDAGSNAGAVYVFERQSGGFVSIAKLVDAGGAANEAFGSAVAVHDEWAVVGAPNASGRGEAHIYHRDSGGTWSAHTVLPGPGAASGDQFGAAVDLSGIWAVVGAPGRDVPLFPSNVGEAYVYQLTPSLSWTLHDTFDNDTPGTDDRLGCSVSVWGNQVAIGADGDDSTVGDGTGAVHVFEYVDHTGDWNRRGVLAPQFDMPVQFGRSVAISRNKLLVGAPLTGGGGRVYTCSRDIAVDWYVHSVNPAVLPGNPSRFGWAVDMCEDLGSRRRSAERRRRDGRGWRGRVGRALRRADPGPARQHPADLQLGRRAARPLALGRPGLARDDVRAADQHHRHPARHRLRAGRPAGPRRRAPALPLHAPARARLLVQLLPDERRARGTDRHDRLERRGLRDDPLAREHGLRRYDDQLHLRARRGWPLLRRRAGLRHDRAVASARLARHQTQKRPCPIDPSSCSSSRPRRPTSSIRQRYSTSPSPRA